MSSNQKAKRKTFYVNVYLVEILFETMCIFVK